MGPRGGDELNLIERGKNYGWPLVSEGKNYDGVPIPPHASRPEFVPPKLFWVPSISPTSLLIYSGNLFPEWKGSGLIGTLTGEGLIRVTFNGDARQKAEQWDMRASAFASLGRGPKARYLLEDGWRPCAADPEASEIGAKILDRFIDRNVDISRICLALFEPHLAKKRNSTSGYPRARAGAGSLKAVLWVASRTARSAHCRFSLLPAPDGRNRSACPSNRMFGRECWSALLSWWNHAIVSSRAIGREAVWPFLRGTGRRSGRNTDRRVPLDPPIAQIIGPAALAPGLGAVAGLDPAAGRLEEILRPLGEPFELVRCGAA